MARAEPAGAFLYTFAGVLFLCLLFVFIATVTPWIDIQWDNDFDACDQWRFYLGELCAPSAGDDADDDNYPTGCHGYGSSVVETDLPWVYDERHSVWRTARCTAALAVVVVFFALLLLMLYACKAIRSPTVVKYGLPVLLPLGAVFSIVTAAVISNSDSADSDKYEDNLPGYVALCGGGTIYISAGAILSIISSVLLLVVGGCFMCCWWTAKETTTLCGCVWFQEEQQELLFATAEPQVYPANQAVVVNQTIPVIPGGRAQPPPPPQNPYVVSS